MIATYVTIYLLVAAVSLLGLSLLAQVGLANNLFFRVLTGGSFGAVSSWYLQGWTPTLSYLEACLNGSFGIGGFACIISLNILAAVWIYNLSKTGKYLVI